LSDHEGFLEMSETTVKTKKAYFARMRRGNYAASLRLEGFSVKEDAVRHSSRQAAVLAYTRKVTPQG
jgi:hypothetical protein